MNAPSLPLQAESPFDADELARVATDFFRALPGGLAAPAGVGGLAQPSGLSASPHQFTGLPPGLQGQANIAPPGSPLTSPAGFGPGVPGTFPPQGLIPGANLVPASPTQLPSLANRAPALLPHAIAGNGIPDQFVSVAPAFEPRSGGAALGVPGIERSPTVIGALPFYFLGEDHGHPTPARSTETHPPIDDRFADSPHARPRTEDLQSLLRSNDAAGRGTPAFATPQADRPQFYFVDSVRLTSGYTTPAKSAPGDTVGRVDRSARPAFDVNSVRRDFPILSERVNGRPLVWFDNAATTQKPQSVIDRLSHFYAHENSNIHRAAHELAARATDAYEKAREACRRFINAPDVDEVLFVRGTTEGINLVAKSWGAQHVRHGDEIVVSHLEHHANIVPWQQLASAAGAKLRVIPVDDSGQVLLEEYKKLLSDRTKIVSVTQVSNALGTVVPVKEIIDIAHRAGARVLIDGAQSVSHMRVDVQALDADFFVFSGHKVFGPTGIGVVWGKRALFEDMPPWQGGGNMIADVTFEKTVYQAIPNKFEAGTGNIADAVGLGAAIEYVERIGIENIARHEHDLLEYATHHMRPIRGVRLIGTAADKASVLSFVLDGHTTDEVGQALNREGIAVRTGHHCALPILRRFGLEATVRPSLAFYNTFDEIDRMVTVVRRLASART